MAKIGRNDNCWCNSGKKYKHCHYEIDLANPDNKYAAAQSVYAKNWNLTSEQHLRNGDYDWLAEQLVQFAPMRVLDIGCGTGQASLALMNAFESEIELVGLDENRNCLQKAKDRLWNELKIETDLIVRGSISYSGDSYVSDFARLKLDGIVSCLLVEADICDDPYLLPALKEFGPFDAVIVWLTGTHMLRQENAIVRSKRITTDGQHRLFVQNTAYELADKVLKKGGVLQVADRLQMPKDDDGREDLLLAHRDQASTTTLEVKSENMAFRPYALPKSGATAMRITPGTSGRMPNNLELAIVSMISVKP